jgi:hypothetical protein
MLSASRGERWSISVRLPRQPRGRCQPMNHRPSRYTRKFVEIHPTANRLNRRLSVKRQKKAMSSSPKPTKQELPERYPNEGVCHVQRPRHVDGTEGLCQPRHRQRASPESQVPFHNVLTSVDRMRSIPRPLAQFLPPPPRERRTRRSGHALPRACRLVPLTALGLALRRWGEFYTRCSEWHAASGTIPSLGWR